MTFREYLKNAYLIQFVRDNKQYSILKSYKKCDNESLIRLFIVGQNTNPKNKDIFPYSGIIYTDFVKLDDVVPEKFFHDAPNRYYK
jgi:hypothetical protein